MKKAICLIILFLFVNACGGCSDGGRSVSPVGPEGETPLDYSTLQIHRIGITQSLTNSEVSLYVDIENTGFQNLTSMVARFIGEPFWDNELFNLEARERKMVIAVYGTNHSDIPTDPSMLRVYILRLSNLDTGDSLAYHDGWIYYEEVP